MEQPKIENFIGIYEDVLPDGLCEKYIDFFKDLESSGFVYDRMDLQKKPPHVIDDLATGLIGSNFVYETKIHYINGDFNDVFWNKCYPEYLKKYSIIDNLDPHKIYEIKIQKTIPGQGYHIWHPEINCRYNSNRLLVFILYLNDVEQGGETEFLYYPVRVPPKKNRMVIWPAGFTHTHRGNQPLSGEKYIITGWVEF